MLLQGSPGSPYTRKMLSLLRYRRIPYEFLIGMPKGYMGGEALNMPGHKRDGLPRAKVVLLPTFFFEGQDGSLEAMVDSTPIIGRLEREHEGRSVVPTDPAIAFLDAMLEEYADEWTTKWVMHFRWFHAQDIAKASKILPLITNTALPDDFAKQVSEQVAARQTGRLHVVGSNETTQEVIESSYARLLELFSEHLKQHPFLMGNRPGASDFALYGQLTQVTQFDPTPMAMALAKGPRVMAWVMHVEDLSGVRCEESGWITADAIPDTLRALLKEMGRVYAPVMLANERAIKSGAAEVRTEVDGKTWVQKPFPYQAKSLQWLREQYQHLSPDDRAVVDDAIAGTGCAALFAS